MASRILERVCRASRRRGKSRKAHTELARPGQRALTKLGDFSPWNGDAYPNRAQKGLQAGLRWAAEDTLLF